MLPAVHLPAIHSTGVNNEILNPSTLIYLRETKPENPFHLLSVPLPVLRFVEVMRTMDIKGARILHATESSRTAMKLVRDTEEVHSDATLVFSDMPLFETLQLAQQQRRGSTMVAVVGELVSRADVQLVYLMCGIYRSVRLHPLTVSHADAERLIIATDLMHRVEICAPPYEFDMSRFFLTKLDELNSMHGQTRLELARAPHRDKTTAWAATFLPDKNCVT